LTKAERLKLNEMAADSTAKAALRNNAFAEPREKGKVATNPGAAR
jgi:hypothetical protein